MTDVLPSVFNTVESASDL